MKPSGTNGTRAAKQQCSQMTDEWWRVQTPSKKSKTKANLIDLLRTELAPP
jgi:hypothetical protein